jgi:hypothetical protein
MLDARSANPARIIVDFSVAIKEDGGEYLPWK